MKESAKNIVYQSFQQLMHYALAVSFILSIVTIVPQQHYTLSERAHPLELIVSGPHSEFILSAIPTTKTEEKIVQPAGDWAAIQPEKISDARHIGIFTFHSTVPTTSLFLRLIYTQITSTCL